MSHQSSSLNSDWSVRVNVERLIVDESLVSYGRGQIVQTAIETELARLLIERGLAPLSDTAVPSLAPSNIEVAEQPRPIRLGQQIARAVYEALDSANSPSASGQSTGGRL
jgi:hypothetical protein